MTDEAPGAGSEGATGIISSSALDSWTSVTDFRRASAAGSGDGIDSSTSGGGAVVSAGSTLSTCGAPASVSSGSSSSCSCVSSVNSPQPEPSSSSSSSYPGVEVGTSKADDVAGGALERTAGAETGAGAGIGAGVGAGARGRIGAGAAVGVLTRAGEDCGAVLGRGRGSEMGVCCCWVGLPPPIGGEVGTRVGDRMPWDIRGDARGKKGFEACSSSSSSKDLGVDTVGSATSMSKESCLGMGGPRGARSEEVDDVEWRRRGELLVGGDCVIGLAGTEVELELEALKSTSVPLVPFEDLGDTGVSSSVYGVLDWPRDSSASNTVGLLARVTA
ncbi:BZ3500_MvSof-1268-A1-R1_Chr4-3g07420 [Microbotryum saponariae]|uniref:BZ3500_MvSof-1268-A1-R1_Chr4-3g07420 protein n=1 Tax=Microbotryum saponariae TaxID=289078 RepID=A0A2X0M4Y4_9BASI|nr:BZ3500_MvSof-1268-A1-R1_Chr4-3g07420 [Microbotryum saponariae]SDA07083.1 BZ3501_MvSof-1269-A2-R1_Chr4-2g07129 [Microbotryum saponariae]